MYLVYQQETDYTGLMLQRFMYFVMDHRYQLAGLPGRGIANCRSWWLSMKVYWITRDRGHLPFVLALLLTVTASSIIIFQANVSSQVKRDLQCLAVNIYHEARGEPRAGQYAVARVTLNRVKSPRYPNTVCEVVYQQKWDRIRRRYVGAFSWTELPAAKKLDKRTWKRAWNIAEAVYHDHDSNNDLKGALFYHANYIKPSWARKKVPVAKIGHHIFYK